MVLLLVHIYWSFHCCSVCFSSIFPGLPFGLSCFSFFPPCAPYVSVRDHTMDKGFSVVHFWTVQFIVGSLSVIIVVIYELIQSFGNVTNGVKALRQGVRGDFRQILGQGAHTHMHGSCATDKQEREERLHFLFRQSKLTLIRCPPSLSSWCAQTLLKYQNMIKFSLGFQGRQSWI